MSFKSPYRRLFLIVTLGFGLTFSPLFLWSQKNDTIKTIPGRFTVGLRSTLSLFSHDEGYPGIGGGGQVRILVHERINTEWFGDVIFTDIGGLGSRQDYHIGWSVMFYILKPKNFKRKILPYIVAGHCFDYTNVVKRSNNENMSRFSSAVQMGVGMHYNITPRWDISLTTQYMLHLGKDIHTEIQNGDIVLEEHALTSWEGHLLINLSINYKLAQLWKPKQN